MRRPLILLFALFCLVHLLLFFWGESRPSVRLTVDSREYMLAAKNWWQNGTFYCGVLDNGIRPALYTKRTPGYPLILTPGQALGRPYKIAVLWQFLFDLAAAGLLLWLASLLELRRSLRILLVAVFLFYPPQLIYTHIVMAEVMLGLLVLLCVTLVAAYLESRKEYFLILANLALAAGAFTKPVLLYAWIPSLLYHGWLVMRRHRPRIVIWALLPLIPIGAWCYRNYLLTDYFHFSSMKAISLSLRIQYLPGALPRPEQATGDLRQQAEQAQKMFIQSRLRRPRTAIRRNALGIGAFFLDPGRFDVYQILGLRPGGSLTAVFIPAHQSARMPKTPWPILAYLLGMLLLNAFVSLAFLYFLFRGRAPLEIRVFSAMLVGYVAVITGTMGTSRYRLDVEPVLLLAVPFFIDWLARRRSERQAIKS